MSGGPLHRQLTTWQVQANETIGGGVQSGSQNLGNLFPEMTAHLFRCIMFVGSKSLGPAHTQGQWIIQKHGSQEAEIGGATVKAHHTLLLHPHRPPCSSNTGDRPLSQLVLGPEHTSLMAHLPPSSLRSKITSSVRLCLTAQFQIAVLHSPSSLSPLYFFSTALTTF